MSVEKIQKAIEQMQEKKSKAEGANEQILARMKKEHGVSTIEEAEKLLRKKKALLEKVEASIQKKERMFNKKWKRQLKKLEEE